MSKRFFLIAGGTVGGLGAVLAITPPQFGSTGTLKLGGASLSTATSSSAGTSSLTSTTTQQATATPATSPATPTPVATKKSTTKKSSKTSAKSATTKSKKTTSSNSTSTTSSNSTTSSSQSTSPAQQSTPTPAAPAAISGTFTGAAAETRFGPVQVQVTIVNNKITNATALQYPTESFRDQEINQQAIPYLIQETLAAQSANIQGVGGASYTSTGWVLSLQSALAKAGL